MILLSLLSGCVDQKNTNDDDLGDEREKEGITLRYRADPFMINDTVEPGYFWLEVQMVEACVLSPNIFTYTMFDRDGNKEERIVHMPDNGLQKIRIETLGELPNVMAGHQPRCADSFKMRLHGVTDGIRLLTHGYSLNESWLEWTVEVKVPAGSSRGETRVEIPHFAYDLRLAGPWDRDLAWRWGTISLLSHEHDFVLQTNQFSSPAGPGNTGYWAGSFHLPGGLHVVLELENSVPAPVTWEYLVQYHVLNEQICDFGLEWETC